MTDPRYGAAPEEWAHFDMVLGLGSDLLPVVSNPHATISPGSKMKGLGKTPSRYNRGRQVGGIPDWTQYRATDADLAHWAKEPDYGICVQTRTVRALDLDIDDPDLVDQIIETVAGKRDWAQPMPVRSRKNAAKVLIAFVMPGEFTKRTIKTKSGIIEFLATGQQFVAIGTHPSGYRYEWDSFDDEGQPYEGLPSSFPTLTADEFERVWEELEAAFAIEPSTTASAPSKTAKLAEAAANDSTAVALHDRGLVLSTERDGRMHITCPFEGEHTTDSAESATSYFPANTGGFAQGHFHCLHAHCAERTDAEFRAALGIVEDYADDYEAVDEALVISTNEHGEQKTARFKFVGDDVFTGGKPLQWWVKGILPKAELAVIIGPPGVGKSFLALDLIMAVARGEEWCGRRVTRGRVGYVIAEGVAGFRNRLQAYRRHHNLPDGTFIHVLPAVPNLLKKEDVLALGQAIREAGGLDILVYDTMARGITGGDENSAQDMGLAIENCRVISEVTGANMVMIHHTGKDASRGARGSNALLGAADVEIEISRMDANRTLTVSKMKDGEDGAQIGFQLKTVPIGEDEDGDPVTSCIVEYGTPIAPKTTKFKNREQMDDLWASWLSLLGDEPITKDALIKKAVEDAAAGGNKSKNLARSMERALDSWLTMGKLKCTATAGGEVISATDQGADDV